LNGCRAVPDLDLARIRQFCDAKIPAQARDEARIDVRGTSVTVLDCRALWEPDVVEWSRSPVAQLRYDPAARVWSLSWADRNSRWRRYDGLGPAGVDDLLAGGSVHDALVGYAAKAHGFVLATRDERARDTYRGLDVEFQFVG